MATSTAADGKTPLHSVIGEGIFVSAVEFNKLYSLATSLEKQVAEKQDLLTNWRKGKGFRPANGKTPEQLYEGYKALWTFWMAENIDLVFELAERVADAGYVLTDCFANTPVNQARALSELLNEFFGL